MSHVTSVTIFTGDYDNELLPVINAWVFANHYRTPTVDRDGFVDLSPHFGGRKHPQVAVWGCAFNYLDIPAFLAFLRSLDWAKEYCAEVVIEDEHDAGRTLVRLHRDEDYRDTPYWLKPEADDAR